MRSWLPFVLVGVWIGCSGVRPPVTAVHAQDPRKALAADPKEQPSPAPAPPLQPPSKPAIDLSSLPRAVLSARGPGRGPYVSISEVEQARVAQWLDTRLRRGTSAGDSPFQEHRIEGEVDLYLLAAPLGHGVYVVREGEAAPWIIEVPHSFADLHTLQVGLELFRRLGARALLVNGTHRRVGCNTQGPCPADVAHAPLSVFQAVHQSLTLQYPAATALAVHGFEARSDDPLAILSAAGTTTPLTTLAEGLRRMLSALSNAAVKTYPDQIRRLGGVTGVQARFSSRVGSRFLHLELAASLRTALKDDAALMAELAQTLAAGGGQR